MEGTIIGKEDAPFAQHCTMFAFCFFHYFYSQLPTLLTCTCTQSVSFNSKLTTSPAAVMMSSHLLPLPLVKCVLQKWEISFLSLHLSLTQSECIPSCALCTVPIESVSAGNARDCQLAVASCSLVPLDAAAFLLFFFRYLSDLCVCMFAKSSLALFLPIAVLI